MKTKITISILLLLCVLVFSFNHYLADDDNLIKKNLAQAPNEDVRKITFDEQKEALNYLSNARSYKYECESSDSEGMFFYKTHETGTDITDLSEFGKGEKVRFCKSGFDKEGYIVRDIVNTGQIKIDSLSDWKIKPRLRIDKEKARVNPDLKVFRVEIINCDGKIIDSTDIFTYHFLNFSKDADDGYFYKGEYIESFFNSIDEWDISIPAGAFNPDNKKMCKADFRIYWFGNCDIWIDHIKVENEIAERLLKGNFDALLSAMDNVNVKELANLKAGDDQKDYISYIIDKIMSSSITNN